MQQGGGGGREGVVSARNKGGARTDHVNVLIVTIWVGPFIVFQQFPLPTRPILGPSLPVLPIALNP